MNLKMYFVAGESLEAFAKDAKLPKITYPEEIDDGALRLHSARWSMLSIKELKYWYEQAPVCRTQKYVNIPLKHVGASNCVADKVIAYMHDQKVALTMKHFLGDNVAVASKPKVTFSGPGGSSTSDYDWTEATTIAHTHEAVLNYQTILHHLFSWNPTGLIIQRVLLKHNWMASYGNLTVRVNIIRSFFDRVMRINASRACNRDIIMDYKEMLDLMETMTARTQMAPAAASSSVTADFRIPKSNSSRVATGGRGVARKSSDNRARYNGLLLCFDYNNTKGANCTRPQTPGGCKEPQGQEYAHRCNMKMSGGAYCLRDHRRKEH